MASCSGESPVFPSPALYPVSAGGCSSHLHGDARRFLEFSESWNGFLLDAPKVLMPATTHGYYLQKGAVRCQIESLIPFTLRFSRDGRRLGMDQFFR